MLLLDTECYGLIEDCALAGAPEWLRLSSWEDLFAWVQPAQEDYHAVTMPYRTGSTVELQWLKRVIWDAIRAGREWQIVKEQYRQMKGISLYCK